LRFLERIHFRRNKFIANARNHCPLLIKITNHFTHFIAALLAAITKSVIMQAKTNKGNTNLPTPLSLNLTCLARVYNYLLDVLSVSLFCSIS